MKQGRKEERTTTTSLNRVKGSKTIKENQHARKKVEGKTRCIQITKVESSKLWNILTRTFDLIIMLYVLMMVIIFQETH